MHIVAVWRMVFQNLHQVFYLFVRLLLIQWFVFTSFMNDCSRICEDEEKSESALILNCLEEGTQLCVLIDLVLECYTIAIGSEYV